MQRASSSGFRAIVIGGTGAIGKCLVNELIESSAWSKVTLITRRQVDLPESDKVAQVVTNMDEMEAQAEQFQEHDVGFCCLGTTRKDAGSAEAFRKVDLDYVTKFARLCKENSIPQFHLVSSTGANSKSWFLYMRTKGEAEDAVKELNFKKTVIYQPGLLGRGEDARTNEKLFSLVVSALPVATMGLVMRVHAEKLLQDDSEGCEVMGNKGIYAIAKLAKSAA